MQQEQVWSRPTPGRKKRGREKDQEKEEKTRV
jgi:hypothetical protein